MLRGRKTSAMKLAGLLVALIAVCAPLPAQNDEPAVHKLPEAMQRKVQFLNPEYLVYVPTGEPNAKLPLLKIGRAHV